MKPQGTDGNGVQAASLEQGEKGREINPATHRYPYALVWTPIHPISWLAPYVGHCGVCDSEGRVHDFSGPFFVGSDAMLFGWPTRYVTVGEKHANTWDSKVVEMVFRYQRQYYDFIGWNCHSLVASVLNATEHERDPLAKLLGGHSVIGVACLFFLRGRHIGFRGVLQTWGGHVCLWLGVVAESLRKQDTECLKLWVLLQLATLAFFVGWYGLLALFDFDSQFGRTRPRSLPPSPALKAIDADESVANCLAMPSAPIPSSYVRRPAEAPGVPAADPSPPASSDPPPPVRRVDSDNHVPMRVDSFGDVVCLDTDDESDDE